MEGREEAAEVVDVKTQGSGVVGGDVGGLIFELGCPTVIFSLLKGEFFEEDGEDVHGFKGLKGGFRVFWSCDEELCTYWKVNCTWVFE